MTGFQQKINKYGIEMVKVFKCHNFKSQSVVQVDGEPVAFYNNKNKLFVATNQCTIEVFSLGNPVTRISCFSTESTVHDIVYCYPGNKLRYVINKQISIACCHLVVCVVHNPIWK